MRDREGKNHLDAARARAKRRAGSVGFTLIELLIVVFLIAILAVLALPAMSTARDDRRCFDYARQIASIMHHAKTRASARGAAHLIAIDGGSNGKGRVLLFEALDGTAAPTGPNPITSCKSPSSTWTWVSSFAPGSSDASGRTALVEGVDLNGTGVEAAMGLKADILLGGVAQTAIAVCVTPGGMVYAAGSGTDIAGAITTMRTSLPFTDVVEVSVQRHRAATAIGLKRRVFLPGSGQPRIKSE
jgi:prepilin-type N-terminal cleavage/methylation domain-containing protein